MTAPTIVHPDTGRVYRLGRTKPKPAHERKFHLAASRYIRRGMPKRPTKTTYGTRAMDCLRQVLVNDQLGCCTASGAFHIEGLWRGNAGTPVKFSDEQVIAFYSATTGYVPGKDATDNGGDEPTVLDWWREHGLYTSGNAISPSATASAASHRIAGHLAVDATNPEEVKNCLWLFGNAYGGYSLPSAWVSPPPDRDGFVWDVAGEPVDTNGHCYVFYDYDDAEDGYKSCSWGLLGRTTRAATAKYGVPSAGGELHVAISQDMLVKATQLAPTGFRWEDMVNEFAALGGNIPPALQHMVA